MGQLKKKIKKKKIPRGRVTCTQRRKIFLKYCDEVLVGGGVREDPGETTVLETKRREFPERG